MEEIELNIIEIEEAHLIADPIPQAHYGMVVDDDPLVADTLAAIVRGHGYTASVAYDGEEALQLALLAPPDFVISDVFMPRLNGVELAVRLHELVPGCKILLVSGQPEEAERLLNEVSPPIRYTLLAKPLEPEELLQELGKVRR